MNKFLLFLLFTCLSTRLFASHLQGAELRYEFNGTNYTIFLTMYADCSGITPPTVSTVAISSVSTSTSFNLTLPQVSSTVNSMACPSQVTNCVNPTSFIPGFKSVVYSATTTLSPANDWVISYSAGARNSSNNMMSGNLYVQTTLDNSAAINSNPVVTGQPYFYMIANSTMTIPLQAADYDGDSIAYEMVQPLAGAGAPLFYAGGMYSVSAPFGTGGTCTLNNTTKTLTVKSTSMGRFVLALKVKEYRNGNLISSYTRDFSMMVTSGSGTITFPVSGSTFTATTCPGQVNSVTVNFTDAGGDSVFVTPTTPVISGFTFTTTTTSGIGVGSATINWTTPSGLNPATLPYFQVKLHAEDNMCPKAMQDYILTVYTKQCVADSVWPGDANGDYTVNIYDPLAIAIANGQTGAARTGASTSWTAQVCLPWTNSFITTNVNMKHADCDGNGTVNTTDLGAVTANYGLTHPKGDLQHKQTGAPPLYFDLAGVNLKPGTTVSIPIKLGDATATVANVYGIATRITVNGIQMTAPTVTTTGSWFGNSSNTLNFTKTTSVTADWAHARTDHQAISGNGTIGQLNFTVPANAKQGTAVKFTFGMTKLIDKDGNEITGYDEQDGNTIIPFTESVGSVVANGMSAVIVPNPSYGAAELQFELSQPSDVEVKVVDIVGKVIWQQAASFNAGNNSVKLPASIAHGLYMVQWNTTAQSNGTVRWMNE